MSFLAPLFLLGGLAVALPVVFHLVRRSSREKMVFSSLMFLKPTPPRMTRRNRLEHIFLLLLRCLAICILSLGFARPFLQKPMAATPAGASGAKIILLVDTSASMRRGGVWPAAMARAQTALKGTSAADQVAVLTFDDQVRTVVSFEQWSAMNLSDRATLTAQQLEESKPTWHSTHLGNALISAAETLEDAGRQDQSVGARRIILITDLQAGSRMDGLQGYEWPRDIEVSVEPVKAQRPTNAGLQWVMDADNSTSAASDNRVRLRVSNSADAEHEQFKIAWAGVAGAATLDAYVPPGQSRIVPAPKLPTNAVGERITLSGDDNGFDNTVFVVQPRAEEVNVLFLGNDKENDPSQLLYYLTRAFQDTRRQIVRIKTLNSAVGAEATSRTEPEASSPPPHVGGYRLMIIANTLSGERLPEVRQFIHNGGTALLVMNDASSARTLGQLAAAPEVSAAEAPVANYAMFGQMDFENPLFAPFSDPRFSDFTRIRFWKHRKLQLDSLADARILARFDDGDPAIVEVPVSRGRIFVFAFSWRPADSQLALSTKFVPLLYSLLEQAGGIRARLAQYRVDDTVDLSALAGSRRRAEADLTSGATANPPPDAGGYLTVRKPDGSQVELASGEKRFSQTDQPGVYEVTGSPAPVRFAVNLDSAESKTAPLPVEELGRLGVPIQAHEVQTAQPASRVQQLHNADLENQQKLWRWLIVAALVVLIVETWLAGWITRRGTARVEATT